MMITAVALSRCLLCGCQQKSYTFPSVRVNRRSLQVLPGVRLVGHPGPCPECGTGSPGAPYPGESFMASPWRPDEKSWQEIDAYRERRWPA